MASSGPPSVLDRRSPHPDSKLVVDRITRRRSPVRANKGPCNDEVHSRIAQPYRTSFSAVVSLPRVRKTSNEVLAANLALERSRSDQGSVSSKSSRRGISPRHVRYDDNVRVRHSDTEDSLMTSLSGQESSYSPLESPRDSSDILSPISAMSSESDKSCPQLIVPSTGTLTNKPIHQETLRGIRKGCENNTLHPGDRLTPNNSVSFLPSESSVHGGDSGVSTDVDSQREKTSKLNINKDYVYDRTISYRMAIQAQYSDEVKRLAEAKVVEKAPEEEAEVSNPELKKSEVCAQSSLPSSQSNDSQKSTSQGAEPKRNDAHFLSHAKKSLSTSMGNFFRRLSPNVRRRTKHHKRNSSTEGSAQSLNTSDSCSIESDPSGHPVHRSNSKSRRSFMKFFGKIHHRNKSHSLRSVGDRKPSKDDLECSQSQDIKQFDPSTQRILKSIEQNSMSDKTIYQKFKAKQPSNHTADAGNKSQAVRPLQATSKTLNNSPSGANQKNKENELKAMSLPLKPSLAEENELEANVSPQSNASTAGAASSVYATSSLSDQNQSIDDFSLAVHTPGSEGTFATSPGSHTNNAAKTHLINNDSPGSLDLGSQSAPDSFIDIPSRKPSYLKLSCSVSGYGKYSVYSSYKDIERRSPFSSSSSLKAESRSTSCEMPAIQSDNKEVTKSIDDSPSKDKELKADMDGSVPASSNGIDGIPESSVINITSTESSHVDGDYFLKLTLKEEEKLSKLCAETANDLDKHHLPDDVSGKIRAAIGKANLLQNKKFKQFRELCQNYMTPVSSEEDHPTKLEDLQGFWEMVQIQIDDVYDMFAEIDLLRQNGWKEVHFESRRSSSSSQKSASVNSTPSHTPGNHITNSLPPKISPDGHLMVMDATGKIT
ncbi:disks large-associated protein 1 isoform X1 [Octopus bimaculoides]|nr:disks large-associated protein 1 isoform X1 [Octopus bimaculoides]XP_014770554.1 disks large-associated protein 1 isoform X1 [Octopus bimaculoides]XP_052824627.1 disks large-associated protein 1 isoform X1 [Octopus bimaculoides]XP_052824629.1 disks large-associated protein 1 isoform X1 [Octopus bimaculoides]|eukprot:XP_014770553.1 PREDICTED: disks large-associated protein 1-like isoform X1 [Octopus bimaculoides]